MTSDQLWVETYQITVQVLHLSGIILVLQIVSIVVSLMKLFMMRGLRADVMAEMKITEAAHRLTEAALDLYRREGRDVGQQLLSAARVVQEKTTSLEDTIKAGGPLSDSGEHPHMAVPVMPPVEMTEEQRDKAVKRLKRNGGES